MEATKSRSSSFRRISWINNRSSSAPSSPNAWRVACSCCCSVIICKPEDCPAVLTFHDEYGLLQCRVVLLAPGQSHDVFCRQKMPCRLQAADHPRDYLLLLE